MPESGEWTGLKPEGVSVFDIDVLVFKYTPAYPKFYEMDSSYPYIKGYYEKQPENKDFHGFPVFEKKEGPLVLYLDSRGIWRINQKPGDQGQGYGKSLEKGSPDPVLAKGWKILMDTNYYYNKDKDEDYNFDDAVTDKNDYYESIEK